ncbi:MAG: TetR family transcriptional regulator, partial [Solirubrobacterales bacterium]|nr:TetR family transcriptional regulator [Solirubrobacterales bacterium]
GWDALSIEAIARRAGITRPVVYRSYPNLQLLLLALLRREDAHTRALLDSLLPEDLGAGAPEALYTTLARFLEGVMAHPRTYRVVLQRPESAPPVLRKLVDRRRAALAEQLVPVVRLGLEGVAAPTEAIDEDILARLLLSTGEELARLALDDPRFPVDRILASAWTLLDLVPLR